MRGRSTTTCVCGHNREDHFGGSSGRAGPCKDRACSCRAYDACCARIGAGGHLPGCKRAGAGQAPRAVWP